MERDLNCTSFQETLGVSLYALGFGIVPLVTASFSEEFGRQPLYLWSGVGFLLFTIATALCVSMFQSALPMLTCIHRGKNIQTVLIARFFAGAFGSTGSTMVGGTVADLFAPHECVAPVVSLRQLLTSVADGVPPWRRSPQPRSVRRASVRSWPDGSSRTPTCNGAGFSGFTLCMVVPSFPPS